MSIDVKLMLLRKSPKGKILHYANELYIEIFVADGINSVGDYNSPPGGCRLSVCLCVCLSPLFFTFHDWITSKRFELSG